MALWYFIIYSIPHYGEGFFLLYLYFLYLTRFAIVFGYGELHKKNYDESIEFIVNYLARDNITCYYYSVINITEYFRRKHVRFSH